MPNAMLLNPSDLKMSADVSVTSNGDGAKTAKVTVVARSGEPVNIPGWGLVVHDFAGMSVKSRIPLDYNHDCEDSIGYLNKFDASSGDLICSGAIVLVDGSEDGDPDDDVTALVAKMAAGVPYEASIQFGDDFGMEYVPEGVFTNVNGRDVSGPVYVVREWTLLAVAVCKFGVDSNTSSEVLMSKEKSNNTKGFFVRFAKKDQMGETKMNSKDPAAEAKAVETVVEAKAVEAKVEAVPVQLSASVVEDAPVVAAPVEATKPAEDAKKEEAPVAEVEKTEAVEAEAVLMSAKSADPRKEFGEFVTLFGNEQAAIYFSAGKSKSDAMAEHVKFLASENADLKKRLSSVERGAEKPVKFSASADSDAKKPQGLQSVIRLGKR